MHQMCTSSLVPADITFPLLKQELYGTPQHIAFPIIKAEELDYDENWWDIKPNKEELLLVDVKQEVVDHGYQAGVPPIVDQGLPTIIISSDDDNKDGSDEELLEGRIRPANKFILDFEPEEMDVSQYSDISFISAKVEEDTSIWDDFKLKFEVHMDEGIVDDRAVEREIEMQGSSECDESALEIPKPSPVTVDCTEEVIMIDDDDDTVINDDASQTSVRDDYDTIVIVDSGDDEHQEENKVEAGPDNEIATDVPKKRTKKKKRKREHVKSKVKSIIIFDGHETKKISLKSDSRTKNVRENKTKDGGNILESSVRIIDDAEDGVTVVQQVECTNMRREINSTVVSSKGGEYAHKMEIGTGDRNGCSVTAGCESSDMTEGPFNSNLLIKKNKSVQNMQQKTATQNMQQYKLIQEREQYKHLLEKQHGLTLERQQHKPTLERQQNKPTQDRQHKPTQEREQNKPTQEREQNKPTQERQQNKPTQERQQNKPTQDVKYKLAHKIKKLKITHKLKDRKSIDIKGECRTPFVQKLQESLKNTVGQCQTLKEILERKPLNEPYQFNSMPEVGKSDQSLQQPSSVVQRSQKLAKLMVILQDFIVKLADSALFFKSKKRNASNEYVESKEGLVKCMRLIKELQNCIKSMQSIVDSRGHGHESILPLNLHQHEALLKELMYCMWLFKKLIKCYQYMQELDRKESLAEMQTAVSDLQHDQSDGNSGECDSQRTVVSQQSCQLTECSQQNKQTNGYFQVARAENNLGKKANLCQDLQQDNDFELKVTQMIKSAVDSGINKCVLCLKILKSFRGLKIHIRKLHCIAVDNNDKLKYLLSQHSPTKSKFYSSDNHSSLQKQCKYNKSVTLQQKQSSSKHLHILQQMHNDDKCREKNITINKMQLNAGQQQLEDSAEKFYAQPSLFSLQSSSTLLQTKPAQIQPSFTSSYSISGPVESSHTSSQSIPGPLQSSHSSSQSRFIPVQSIPKNPQLKSVLLQSSPTTSQSRLAPVQSSPTFSQSEFVSLHSRSPFESSHTASQVMHPPLESSCTSSQLSTASVQSSCLSSQSRTGPLQSNYFPSHSSFAPVKSNLSPQAMPVSVHSGCLRSQSRSTSEQPSHTSSQSRPTSEQSSPTSSQLRSVPLESSSTSLQPKPAPVQSNFTFSQSRVATVQSSPTASQLRPSPLQVSSESSNLFHGPVYLPQNDSHLQPSTLHSSPAGTHLSTPDFHSESSSELNQADNLHSKTIYTREMDQSRARNMQQAVKAKFPNGEIMMSRGEYRSIKEILFKKVNNRSKSYLNQKSYANQERHHVEQLTHNSEVHGHLPAETVWQGDESTISQGRKSACELGLENPGAYANTGLRIPRNFCSLQSDKKQSLFKQCVRDSATDDQQPFNFNTRQSNPCVNHATNHNFANNTLHTGMHVRKLPENCYENSPHSSGEGVSWQLRCCNKHNYRQISSSIPCVQAPTSNIHKTKFATSASHSRHVAAGNMLGHYQGSCLGNHTQWLPGSGTHVQQPVIVANYNSITYVQNHIPCAM